MKTVLRAKTKGNSVTMTKIGIAIGSFVIGFVVFLTVVYGIIPTAIADMSTQMESEYATELFNRTVKNEEPPGEAAAFEQGESVVEFPRDCFVPVLKENPDIVGRVSIDSMDIGYLVAQSIDNDYYLKHGYDRKESKSGAVFLDYRCNAESQPLKGHYILYGHNMKNGSMFHNLNKYADADFFEKNRMIRFDTLYKDYEWEVFSTYVTSTDFYYIDTTFKDDTEWLDFLHQIQQKSLHQTDIELQTDDVVLTLSTCDYSFENARFVVHARLVTKD